MFCKIVTLISLLQYCLVPASSKESSGHHQNARRSISTDKAALLAFKNGLSSSHPSSILASWTEQNDVCNFSHVQCGKLHHRVVAINLNDSTLTGLLSPVLANLTQLRSLSLANNHFYGSIPQELSKLRYLQQLSLGTNNLQGLIPASLSSLSQLKFITLDDNNLSGEIPAALFSNCTKLVAVDFSGNQLTGKIPAEINNCPDLQDLNLYSNQLHGEIPASLGNVTSLVNLDVEYNSISGELPSETLGKLYNMWYLHLSNNNMVSHDNNSNLEPFFTALANCTYLLELQLSANGIGGRLTSSIGGLSRNLGELQLQENQISGSVLPGVGNLSSLTILNLTSNFLTGTAAEIGVLKHLEQLSLSFNYFTRVPTSLGNVSSLGLVDLSHNNLSGQIPEELGGLTRLGLLFLNNNLFSGRIPSSLGRCTALQTLDLSYNRLTGKVPPIISGFLEMRRFLNLSHNQLEGNLPIEISKLSAVEEIDLSSNNFSGNIFADILNCWELKVLNLSNNFLQGHLLDSLGGMTSLATLDVSSNNLSGLIPTGLNNITTLTFLDLSHNDFSGAIPTGRVFDGLTNLSFIGNQHLCGHIPGIQVCNRKQHYFHSRIFLIIFCIVTFISVIFTIICCVMGYRRLRVIMSSSPAGMVREQPPDLTHNFPRITYKELLESTNGFDDQRLVGTGSYGRVYRGVLPNGTQIAVKVLNLQTGNSTKSFNRECQVLKRIRHRNLIRIITACSLPEFKALVLPYMANGSLDSRLYPHTDDGLRSGSSDLSLLQRVNTCSDIAEGMAYLHHHSPVKVIHCDLKPSNVLLNDDMTALVSDFGISRLVAVGAGNGTGVVENMGNSTANMLSGSIGYIAPGMDPFYFLVPAIIHKPNRMRNTKHEYFKRHYFSRFSTHFI